MAVADAATVEVGPLVLHADGGFEPRQLPRRAYAPIDFQGYFDISAKGGGVPAEIEQAIVDFDRDGRLNVRGLPTCPVERIRKRDAGRSAKRLQERDQSALGVARGDRPAGAGADLRPLRR